MSCVAPSLPPSTNTFPLFSLVQPHLLRGNDTKTNPERLRIFPPTKQYQAQRLHVLRRLLPAKSIQLLKDRLHNPNSRLLDRMLCFVPNPHLRPAILCAPSFLPSTTPHQQISAISYLESTLKIDWAAEDVLPCSKNMSYHRYVPRRGHLTIHSYKLVRRKLQESKALLNVAMFYFAPKTSNIRLMSCAGPWLPSQYLLVSFIQL
jgi:hypothetical protein